MDWAEERRKRGNGRTEERDWKQSLRDSSDSSAEEKLFKVRVGANTIERGWQTETQTGFKMVRAGENFGQLILFASASPRLIMFPLILRCPLVLFLTPQECKKQNGSAPVNSDTKV